jgi:hypothetical protein
MGLTIRGSSPARIFGASSVWLTLHRDYQRSGYTNEIVKGPYERKWYMQVYCVNPQGKLLWPAPRLQGLSLRDHAPTLWRGRDTYGGIFGPGALPGKFDETRKRAQAGYSTGMPNEWHGPDRSIVSIGYPR